MLGRSSLTLQAIQAAVIKRARAELERPTPGQIYHEAAMIEREAAERARYSRKAIEYTPSDDERARVKAGFKDLIARLTKKMGMERHD